MLAVLFCLAALASRAQPANDDFANRTLIKGTQGSFSSTLAGATSEPGEPLLDGISSGQTAWWSWVAPADGQLFLSVDSTNFNPLLTVFTGDQLASLSLVASNNYLMCYSDGDCGCHWRMRDSILFHVVRGQAYQLSIDSPIVTDGDMEESTNPPAITENPGGLQLNDPSDTNAPTEYYGVYFSTNVAPGSNFDFTLVFTHAPPNDDFDHAILLSGARTSVVVNNSGATMQPGEPEPADNTGGSSVWYKWTAMASGRVTLSTNAIAPYEPPAWSDVYEFGLDMFSLQSMWGPPPPPTCGDEVDQDPPPVFFPVISAYTGTNVAALTSANVLQMGLPAYPDGVEFDAVKGVTYHIACDGNMGTTNAYRMELALTTPARNDAFARRIHLQGIDVDASGYNAGAVPQADAPDIGNGSTGKLAWWSWISPVDADISIDVSNSDYAFPLGVFTGTNLSTLDLVAAGAGSLDFSAVTGQEYQIAVGDLGGLTGKISMVIQGPVVEAPLLRVTRSPGLAGALLEYGATPGQVLQLQRMGTTEWKAAQMATAHHDAVNFLVRTAPATNGPTYRAVIVNYIPQRSAD